MRVLIVEDETVLAEATAKGCANRRWRWTPAGTARSPWS